MAAHWADMLTLGSVLIALIIGAITLGGIIYTVLRKSTLENAKTNAATWESNFKAERVKAEDLAAELVGQRERLNAEITDLRVAFAKQLSAEQFEQRELQHALKAEKDAAEKEASVLRKLRDTTEVLQGVQEILAQLARSKDMTTEVVAELLEKADERAAIRDATIIATQRELLQLLERLTDRIVGEVGEIVQEKVDQIQTDLPSPDQKT